MKKPMLVVFAVTLIALAGCNQAKSPDTVQKDVEHAAASGEKHIDHAEQREQRADANAEQSAANSLNRATGKEVSAAVDTALAHAEAGHKVALSQCEAYLGDQRKSCKNKADADWESAKASAKAIKAQD